MPSAASLSHDNCYCGLPTTHRGDSPCAFENVFDQAFVLARPLYPPLSRRRFCFQRSASAFVRFSCGYSALASFFPLAVVAQEFPASVTVLVFVLAAVKPRAWIFILAVTAKVACTLIAEVMTSEGQTVAFCVFRRSRKCSCSTPAVSSVRVPTLKLCAPNEPRHAHVK